VGCLPMQDEPIEEIFWLVTMHQHQYPEEIIPVHIFPFRFTEDNWFKNLASAPKWETFWTDLRSIDTAFEMNRYPAKSRVNSEGRYMLVD